MAEQQSLIPAPPQTDPEVEARAVFDLWVKLMGKRNPRFDGKRLARVRWGIKTYGLQDCLDAVRGCAADEHHRSSGYKWADLPLIFRDASHVERFRDSYRLQKRKASMSARPGAVSPPEVKDLLSESRQRNAELDRSMSEQQFDMMTKWWSEEAKRERLQRAAENGCEWAAERMGER